MNIKGRCTIPSSRGGRSLELKSAKNFASTPVGLHLVFRFLLPFSFPADYSFR